MLKEDNENLSTIEKDLGAFGVLDRETAKKPLKLSDKLTQPKFLAGSLAVLVVLVVIFSATNLLNSLKTPFALSPEDAKLALSTLNFNNNANSENLDIASLSLLDTDNDGLSDYEEMSVYQTSRYITDSDSDGIGDGDEVKAGTDPNCPTGQTCQIMILPDTATSTIQTPVNSQVTTEQARQWLIGQGLTAAELSKLDDTSLLQLYQEANKQAVTKAPETGNVNLDQITSDQLRSVLRDGGVSEAELNKLSDADLQGVWREIVAAEKSKTNQ